MYGGKQIPNTGKFKFTHIKMQAVTQLPQKPTASSSQTMPLSQFWFCCGTDLLSHNPLVPVCMCNVVLPIML
jgi:hypothetical protein